MVELRKAVTVISVVFAAQKADQRQRQGDYIRKLHDIASYAIKSQVGAAYSLLALQSFRDEFVLREAYAVKNQYIWKLGLMAALFAAGFSALYLLTLGVAQNEGFVHHLLVLIIRTDTLLIFFMLAIGASLGTWLSFSLRKPIIGFDDLAVLEEDRLTPWARILFVIGLTMVIGLMLHHELLHIKIGTKDVDLKMSFLLGLICGISERALAGAVSRRSSSIVDGIGVRPDVPVTTKSAESAAPGRASP